MTRKTKIEGIFVPKEFNYNEYLLRFTKEELYTPQIQRKIQREVRKRTKQREYVLHLNGDTYLLHHKYGDQYKGKKVKVIQSFQIDDNLYVADIVRIASDNVKVIIDERKCLKIAINGIIRPELTFKKHVSVKKYLKALKKFDAPFGCQTNEREINLIKNINTLIMRYIVVLFVLIFI